MTDLVVVSLEAWDGVWRRNQHLITGLLRRDPTLRVLFVEPSADPLHALVRRGRPRPGRGLRVGPSLDGVSPGHLWLHQPTKALPRKVDPRADDRLVSSVVGAAERVGFEHPLLWVNDPAAAYLLAATGWRTLYDVTDDWLEADRSPAEHDRLVRNENFLLRHCTEVVVCSHELLRTKRSHARSITLIQNAVDLDLYRLPTPRPPDLPAGPVAVYVGTVHTDRMDLELCEATARALQGVGHLVLVGPAPLDRRDRDRLRAAGTVLLGAKEHKAVPGYLQHADVLVVPHVRSPFTDTLDPIKVYEYRAVGRPIVSTPVSGFRDDPRVTVASTDEFAEAVRQSLPTTAPFPEGAAGEVPTWADRVTQMAEVLGRLVGTKEATQ